MIRRYLRYKERVTRLVLAVLFGMMLAARSADACGYFFMEDHERHLLIENLINAATISTVGKDGKADKTVTTLYYDTEYESGLRVSLKNTVVFDVRGSDVLKYGKVVGTIASNGDVSFGKHTYKIELTDERLDKRLSAHGVTTWTMTVKRGDTLVLDSAGVSALCAALGGHRDARDEVRRRIIFYLAWRET